MTTQQLELRRRAAERQVTEARHKAALTILKDLRSGRPMLPRERETLAWNVKVAMMQHNIMYLDLQTSSDELWQLRSDPTR